MAASLTPVNILAQSHYLNTGVSYCIRSPMIFKKSAKGWQISALDLWGPFRRGSLRVDIIKRPNDVKPLFLGN